MTNAVHFFQDLTPELAPLAGGKGAALARLVRAGYPVPEGFVVLTSALAGDEAPFATAPARRATHARYSALPPYPALIRGRFDPVQWAADPQRRSDVFAPRSGPPPGRDPITGFPGAAGRVEGRVRVDGAAGTVERLSADA